MDMATITVTNDEDGEWGCSARMSGGSQGVSTVPSMWMPSVPRSQPRVQVTGVHWAGLKGEVG